MGITTVKQFIANLNEISPKTVKQAPSVPEITTALSQALNVLTETESLEISTAVSMLGQLRSGIENYVMHVGDSALALMQQIPGEELLCHQRVVALYNKVVAQEKIIETTEAQIAQANHKLQDLLKITTEGSKEEEAILFTQKINAMGAVERLKNCKLVADIKIEKLRIKRAKLEKWSSIAKKVKIFLMKLFERIGTTAQFLYTSAFAGSTLSNAFSSILSDLQRFLREQQNPSQLLCHLTEKALPFTMSIAQLLDNPTPTRQQLHTLAKTLQQKVSECCLSKRGEGLLLIPYGHHGEPRGHVAMMQVESMGNGKVSVTLVNTGEGAKITEDGKKAIDVVFTDITPKEFSLSFIKTLFQFWQPANGPSTMEEVNATISQHLCRQDNSNRQEGRTHALQKEENCAAQSVLSCLRGIFGKKLYRSFLLSMYQHNLKEAKKWTANRTYRSVLRVFVGGQGTELTSKWKELLGRATTIADQIQTRLGSETAACTLQ
jgi:hypothetical protein